MPELFQYHDFPTHDNNAITIQNCVDIKWLSFVTVDNTVIWKFNLQLNWTGSNKFYLEDLIPRFLKIYIYINIFRKKKHKNAFYRLLITVDLCASI